MTKAMKKELTKDMVKDNSLHFNLVSKHLGADRFRHYFLEALREMREVFEATTELKAKL